MGKSAHMHVESKMPWVSKVAWVQALTISTYLLLVIIPSTMGKDDMKVTSELPGFDSELYSSLGRAPADSNYTLALVLKPRALEALEQRFWQISDPTHADYGRHLTKEQADELAMPQSRALELMSKWAARFQHTRPPSFVSASNTYKIHTTVGQVEEALSTELHEYAHVKHRSRRILRAQSSISLPRVLLPFLSYVNINAHPLHLRALGRTSPSYQPVGAQALGGGTLDLLRKTYAIPDDLVVTNASNSQCTPAFYDEAWDPRDLAKFFDAFLPRDEPPRVIQKGSRENIPKKASSEASLDVQYLTGIGRNATTYMWSMNGSNPFSKEDEPFVEFAETILAMESPPFVVSISYSDDEEHIFNVSDHYARSLDTLLMKMGLRGISVLVASGDDGVSGLRPEFAHIPHDRVCEQSGPQWPSSSPYITTVGATMLLIPQDVPKPFFYTDEEVVCSGELGAIITSGGGFSNVYPRPKYQDQVVSQYLEHSRHSTKPGFFNHTGRAYPDIAALGAAYMVFMKGSLTSVSGTSASTPAIAGMVTLWNDMRLNSGKTPLGFLNPLLYYIAAKHPMAFHDVVTGNNGGTKITKVTCFDSFGAAPGWDAVSGVGTPNFTAIAKIINELDDLRTIPSPTRSNSSNTTCTQQAHPIDAGAEVENFFDITSTSAVLAVIGIVVVGVFSGWRIYRRWQYRYSSLSSATPSVDSSNMPEEVSRKENEVESEMIDVSLKE